MPGKSYVELLRDPRWQRRRLEVLNRAEFACESCGDATQTLHVHHKIYRKGALPWDYADQDLVALCETCHEGVSLTRRALDEAIAALGPYHLERLLGFAEGLGARLGYLQKKYEPEACHSREWVMRTGSQMRGFVTALWHGGGNGPRLVEPQQVDLEAVERFIACGPERP